MNSMFSAILLSETVILLMLEAWSLCSAKNITVGCIATERKALLKLRESLSDPANRLSSWKDNDCCSWLGITCNKFTGHVISLDLKNNETYDNGLQGITIDPSLLELKQLSYLDLSRNNFQCSRIPAFIGSMKQLQHLNLSYANFDGVVPQHLGSLSSLRVLDLSDDYERQGRLIVDDLMWAANLSSLVHLDMSCVDLSGTKHLVKVLNILPSLVVLRLSWSGLDNTHLPHDGLNCTLLTNVQYLDLSLNSFDGEFPCFLQNMTSLISLDLSRNWYKSSGPLFRRLKKLAHLDLSSNILQHKVDQISEFMWDKCHLKSLDLSGNQCYGDISGLFKNLSAGCWSHNLESLNLGGNKYSGPIPIFLGNLSALTELDISQNSLSGPIPISLGNLLTLTVLDISQNSLSGPIPISLGNLLTLTMLDISYNSLSGPIPISLGNLSALTELAISHNNLSGPIPSSIGNLGALRVLDLYGNQLNGEIPISLGQLSNLEELIISFSNSLEGALSEAHFANLSKLDLLFAEMLKLRVAYDWVPPFQLNTLSMKSCEIGGQFPQWLQTQKALTALVLSNCGITGILPKWRTSINLTGLDLSHNHIKGPIPELSSSITNLDLSDNMINHVPSNITQMLPLLQYLFLAKNSIRQMLNLRSSSMILLDLSHNMIINHIPSNIGQMLPLLGILLLEQNFINGSIPDSLCEMKDLQMLDLSKNHLSGNLPSCWPNFRHLTIARLSSNELSGVIPNSIGGASSLQWLHLNNNSLTGQLPSGLKNCTDLIVLDVGDNNLSGKLPEWIGNYLLHLQVLRLRNNDFYGTIPSAFCQPYQLQVLDLAHNKLTGKIPHCFGNLSGMIKSEPTLLQDYPDWVSESLIQVMKGVELEYTTTSVYVVNLDLSSNRLVGEIPLELTNLSILLGLNLSHNHLEGKIPGKIGDLKSLVSLDLSNNNLFGNIPESLSSLSFLSHLNLSNNNLSRQIPTGPQLQTLNDPSIYIGNPQLCGAPLPKKCHNIDEVLKVPNAENHATTVGEGEADKIYFYGVIISGFATGFWGIIGVLVFKASWRQAYFQFAEAVIGKILGG